MQRDLCEEEEEEGKKTEERKVKGAKEVIAYRGTESFKKQQ